MLSRSNINTPPYEIFIYIAGDTLRIIGNNKKHISGIAGRFYVYIILPEMETNIQAPRIFRRSFPGGSHWIKSLNSLDESLLVHAANNKCIPGTDIGPIGYMVYSL